MKKITALGFMLFAVFALTAATASIASAAEWLSDGATIPTALASKTTGLLELINLVEKGSTNKLVTVDCEGILDGTVGPGAADLITNVLSLAGVNIPELKAGEELNCKVTQTAGGALDCILNELASVWPAKIATGWDTEVELMTTGPEFLDILLSGGYEVECKTPLGTLANTCEGETSAELKNVTGGVEGIFNAAAPISSQATNCTLTGTGTGLLEGKGLITLENGLTLTVSE
jgi:hypothetical protein